MVDDERLKQLRALGIKTASFVHHPDGVADITFVEFFPSIPALDLDTLVPPPGDSEEKPVEAPIPAALARILQRKSVS